MQHPSLAFDTDIAAPAADFARLHQVLASVQDLAGVRATSRDVALNEVAWVSSVYAVAPEIVQRRFDTLTAETALWADASREALFKAPSSASAATLLADELRYTIGEITRLLQS
jgi:type III secretory pathway component EscR